MDEFCKAVLEYEQKMTEQVVLQEDRAIMGSVPDSGGDAIPVETPKDPVTRVSVGFQLPDVFSPNCKIEIPNFLSISYVGGKFNPLRDGDRCTINLLGEEISGTIRARGGQWVFERD